MIKDIVFALNEQLKNPPPEAVLTFVDGDTPDPENPQRMLPVPKLTQKEPFTLPYGIMKGGFGFTTGQYLLGQLAENIFQYEEQRKDWRVLRFDPALRETEIDRIVYPAPAYHVPVIANILGRKKPAVGFFIIHEIAVPRENGKITDFARTTVFLEISEETSLINVTGLVRRPNNGEITPMTFNVVQIDHVIGWAHLSADGLMMKPKEGYPVPVELFVDCEFDDSTKTLISVGIITKLGNCYYAFDRHAAAGVKDPWIQENVNGVLMDLPASTMVTDLNAKGISFSTWLQEVIQSEQGEDMTNSDRPVIIHTDFPTDVAYISNLLHLGQGRRIGMMKKFTFQISYVDPYPSKLEKAVQHNAMWDAVALWYHLGYSHFAVMRMVYEKAMRQAGQIQLPDSQVDLPRRSFIHELLNMK